MQRFPANQIKLLLALPKPGKIKSLSACPNRFLTFSRSWYEHSSLNRTKSQKTQTFFRQNQRMVRLVLNWAFFWYQHKRFNHHIPLLLSPFSSARPARFFPTSVNIIEEIHSTLYTNASNLGEFLLKLSIQDVRPEALTSISLNNARQGKSISLRHQ